MTKYQGFVHKNFNEVVRQPLCGECLTACLPKMAFYFLHSLPALNIFQKTSLILKFQLELNFIVYFM